MVTDEKKFMEDYQQTWALAFMSGFLAAKGFDDAVSDYSAARRVAEEEGLIAMGAKPFWGEGNVKAYHKAKRERG